MPVSHATSLPLPSLARRRDRDGQRPAQTPQAPAETPPREHLVQRGETLTSIAQQHGTTVAAVLEANASLRRHPNHLPVGARVRLPGSERSRADATTVSSSRRRAAGAESLARGRVGGAEQLRRGLAGPAVRTLQGQLNTAGSARPALVLDGAFGPRTEAAVKRYQSSRGLPPSGVVDDATRAALAASRPAIERPLAQGSFGAAVRDVQTQLNANGAQLAVDGDFGAATERAVRALQRANRLSETGVVDAATRAALASPTAQRIPAPAAGSSTATGYRQGRAFSLELVSIGNGEAMSRPAAEAFTSMKAAAARDGVHLNVVSGFRSNEEQRSLYAAYLRGDGNLAARPGYSNHQNGIAVDITTGGSRRSESYRWLAANGARFGFHNTVASEPWHWEHRR